MTFLSPLYRRKWLNGKYAAKPISHLTSYRFMGHMGHRLTASHLAGPLLFGLLLPLAACQHRPASETVTDWIHGVKGGEIYKLRPPPPGYDQRYPHIGRTPTTDPVLPSEEARAAITARLEAQRNYAQRLAASTGSMPGRKDFSAPSSPSRSLSNQASPDQATTNPTMQGQTSPLPQLVYAPVDHTLPAHLPEVGPPPAPISFPGFTIPSSGSAIIPDFETQDPTGRLVRFRPATDELMGNQDERLNTILTEHGTRPLVLYGFGATSGPQTGLAPQEQAHEITLALLRARKLAAYFMQHGVPASMIYLKAEAIGDGVRVRYGLEKKPASASSTASQSR